MFERYTEKARRVIFFARYEASVLGSGLIEPPHLLLGLLREDKGLFVKLLPDHELLQNAAELMGLEASGQNVNASVDLPLSTAAKRVLVFAVEEAERLNHQHVSPGHLLLGLLREPGVAQDLLAKRGLQLAAVREALDAVVPANNPLPTNYRIMRDLRAQFELMRARLQPELEPAVSYRLPVGKEK